MQNATRAMFTEKSVVLKAHIRHLTALIYTSTLGTQKQKLTPK